MKLFLIVLIVALVNFCYSQKTDFSLLEQRKDGNIYKKGIDSAFTGECKGFINKRTENRNIGLAFQAMDMNEELYIEGTILNGKEEGLWFYKLRDGKIKAFVHFKNGLINGIWVRYYDNGSLEAMGSAIDGRKNGIFYGWDENGIIELEYYYKNDTLIWDKIPLKCPGFP